jgi:hypothetical protein
LAYRQAGRQDQNFHLRSPSAGSPLIFGGFANSIVLWRDPYTGIACGCV